jgi:cyclic pyranopterin phosphate synthase
MNRNNQLKGNSSSLVDPFGRTIDYLRLSVTDRCNLRCTYCMAEDMTFLPRQQILSLEELRDLALAFVELGIKKIRLTGGEPLVRRDIIKLVRSISNINGLEEITMTTNGMLLPKMAQQLKQAGLARLNISVDSLKPNKFREMTRNGDLSLWYEGIVAAKKQISRK